MQPPYEPLPPLSASTRQQMEREALRANDRYMLEVIERYAFCPFAREGRKVGETQRFVHWADAPSIDPLVRLMEVTIASGVVVTQIILPLVETSASDWSRFCHELTRVGHSVLGGSPSLAVAPLHPELSFGLTPLAMVPLFRRSPDPTIQWVRLDGLASIYAGRDNDATYVTASDVAGYISGKATRRRNLYDRIAETNASMAQRLGVDAVASTLAEISADARARYLRLLLADGDDD